MAIQKSILKLEGSLDGMTFYKTKDGHMVRAKGGIPKERILNDPKFARTRENMTEFKHCAQAGQTLRKGVRNLLKRAKDGKVSVRITKLMHELKRRDTTSPRGERKVWIALEESVNRQLFTGLEFNKQSPLHSMFYADFSIDEATDTLDITAFKPDADVEISPDATHISITFAKADIGFETGRTQLALSETLNLPVNSPETAVILSAPLGVVEGIGMYCILVEFFQEVNGMQYSLHNGTYNMLSIVKVL